jgi:hypothetical protein
MDNIRNLVESTLVPHTAFENGLKRLEQCFTHAERAEEPICIAVIGESRTGKSRVIEECAERHPTVRGSEGLTIPILRVKTPSTPTIKGLAEAMLDAMQDPRAATGTEFQKTKRLKKLMAEAGTRMLMIDEFQHFYDRMSNKIMHRVADWLKIMVDETKVALVVAGLPSCRAVLRQNEQLAGRFFAPIVMPRFEWTRADHRDEFIAILEAFQESLHRHFELPALHSDEMAFRCYCATGGLIGYLTKFLRQAVWNAMDAGADRITFEDLRRAHEEAVLMEAGPGSAPSPFARDFPLESTERLLESIRAIGTRPELPPERTTRRRRGRHSVLETLSAS